jgi:hypothetical protein
MAGTLLMQFWAFFAWSMKFMLGGVHPLARHDGQPLDPARLAWAGKPLGFTGGLFQARGDWAWYQQIFGVPAWNSKHVCWRCKATSCDTMPYWDFCFSEGATRRTSIYKPGAFFQGTKACQINCQSTIQLSKVHFGQCLHWCYALCGLGGGSISSWQHIQ